jgi:hypothetical protein
MHAATSLVQSDLQHKQCSFDVGFAVLRTAQHLRLDGLLTLGESLARSVAQKGVPSISSTHGSSA